MTLDDFVKILARWQRALDVKRRERAYFGWPCLAGAL